MSQRTVVVYWNSTQDAQQDAEDYCLCVRRAATDGCEVTCTLIDTKDNDPPESTIKLVGKKDGSQQWSELSPAFDTVRELVGRLCKS